MKKNREKLDGVLGADLSAEEKLIHLKQIIQDRDNQIELLKKENERLSVIIDLIPNTISWINDDLTYFGVNRALADACGVDAAEFIGKKIGFFTKERFFYEFATELFRSNSTTIYREIDAKIGNEIHTYLVSGTKLNDKKRAVVIGVDITELNQLKGHISLTEKLATLGEMFAGIIHDINNPLAMIEGNTKRIKKRVQDEEVHEILSKIEMSSQKISKIVSGIKVYIREDSQSLYANEPLWSIIEDAVIICEHKLNDKRIPIHLDQALKEITCYCNYTQIFQVFVNLITNSIDAIATLNERWIEISYIGMKDGKHQIQFRDSGNGIPVDVQEKIFQAFYTTKPRGIGSGLGLSLCRKILEAHNGSIEIDNTSEYTTFKIEVRASQ